MIRRRAFALVATAVAVGASVAGEDRFETVSGSVSSFSAARHELAMRDESGADRRFTWTKETKFNGVVTEGARVSVRYAKASGGRPAEALSVSVLK